MTFQPQRTAIIGATGPTGIWLARELTARGLAVRVIGRSLARLQEVFAELPVEPVAADATDAEALGRAVDGCDLLVDCIGVPPERMADHPRTAKVIADLLRRTGARGLQVSSYWAFLPTEREVIDEKHPREGGHPYMQARRAAEDVLLQAGAAVVHLPDFFGPHVHVSTVQNALADAARGRPMQWVGGRDVLREAVFVPDAMRMVADLIPREQLYGTDWGLPGNGLLSADQLAAMASRHLGREVAVRAAPPWMLRLLALFTPDLRAIMPMVPHYASPVRYETSKVRGLLGEPVMRSLDEAVGETLEWLSGEAS